MFRWLLSLFRRAPPKPLTPWPAARPAPLIAPSVPPSIPQPIPPARAAPPANLLSHKIVFIDVETTGLHSKDRIVSLGAVLLDAVRIKEGEGVILAHAQMHLIFDPGLKSHPMAEKVHGYDDWTLRHQPLFADHVEEIVQFISKADVIAAHNIDFDLSFIERELALCGRTLPRMKFQCTMEMARESGLFPRSGLGAVSRALGYAQSDVHSAIEDAWLSLLVFLRLKLGMSPDLDLGAHKLKLENYIEPPPATAVLPRRKRRMPKSSAA